MTIYRTNGRSGDWDMIIDTSWINTQIRNAGFASIDSLSLSGDTLFMYMSDGSSDTVLYTGNGAGWWTESGGNITNRNTGFVIVDSLFKVFPLPPEAASLGKIKTIEANGQEKWTTPQAIIGAGMEAETDSAGLFSPWIRDTATAQPFIHQAHDTDYVRINHKLQIGEDKNPAYNLEVTGTTYLNGDITVNDTIWLMGGEVIYATGNGAITLQTGGRVTIKDALHLNPTASPPGGATQGDLYFDTDGHLYIYNGSAWKQLSEEP